jgi:hypothetical protein
MAPHGHTPTITPPLQLDESVLDVVRHVRTYFLLVGSLAGAIVVSVLVGARLTAWASYARAPPAILVITPFDSSMLVRAHSEGDDGGDGGGGELGSGDGGISGLDGSEGEAGAVGGRPLRPSMHRRAAAGAMTPLPKSAAELPGEYGVVTAVAVVCRQLMYSWRVWPGRCETRSPRAPETIGHAMLVPLLRP